MKIELTKAITYQDKEYKEIEFDFDSLTGAEILEASSVFQGIGTGGNMNKMYESLLPQLSMQFQAKVAAMAAKVPYEVVLKLPATEFLQVTNMAKKFFIAIGLMPRMGLRVRFETIRKATLAMSVATYTPVPYWLSIPLVELARWVEDFLQIQKEAKASH